MAGSEVAKSTTVKPATGAHSEPSSESTALRNQLEALIRQNGLPLVLDWVRQGVVRQEKLSGLVDNALRQPPYLDDSTFMGSAPEIQIRRWWNDTARADCEAILPKALEYSSVDLTTVGAGLPGVQADDVVRTEAGIAFYLLGKVARLTGAYGEGRVPSDDTWHDVTVYSKMGRFVRKFGYWGVTSRG